MGIFDTCVWRHDGGHQHSVPCAGCSLNFFTNDACLVGIVINSMHITNYTCKYLCDSSTCNRLESEVNAWCDVQRTGIGMRATLESP